MGVVWRVFFLILVILPASLASSYEHFREDQNSSNVWVAVNLSASGSTTLYVMNNSGIVENGSRVFPLFDDFRYFKNETWNVTVLGSGNPLSYVDGNVTIEASNGEAVLYSKETFAQGYAIDFFGRFDFGTSTSHKNGGGWSNCSLAWNASGCFETTTFEAIHDPPQLVNFLWLTNNTYECSIGGLCLYSTTSTGSTSSNGGFNFTFPEKKGNTQLFEVKRLSNESAFSLNFSTQVRRVYNTSHPGYVNGSLHVEFFNTNSPGSDVKTILDWVFVRPAVYNESTVVRSTGANGQLVYTITNNENTALTNYPVRLQDVDMGGSLLNIQSTQHTITDLQITSVVPIQVIPDVPMIKGKSGYVVVTVNNTGNASATGVVNVTMNGVLLNTTQSGGQSSMSQAIGIGGTGLFIFYFNPSTVGTSAMRAEVTIQ